jgi:hypothetical protein
MTQSIAERWATLFEDEYPASRRIIGALPDVHHSFKPHAKSMAAGLLAWHIAFGFKWDADLILSGNDLIVEPGYTPPPPPGSTDEILKQFDHTSASAREMVRTDRRDQTIQSQCHLGSTQLWRRLDSSRMDRLGATFQTRNSVSSRGGWHRRP